MATIVERDGKRYEVVFAIDCTKKCSFAKKSKSGICEKKCYVPKWWRRIIDSALTGEEACLQNVDESEHSGLK